MLGTGGGRPRCQRSRDRGPSALRKGRPPPRDQARGAGRRARAEERRRGSRGGAELSAVLLRFTGHRLAPGPGLRPRHTRTHRRRPPQAGCGMESRRQAALSPASPPLGGPGSSLASPLAPRLGWEGRAQRPLPAMVWLPPREARADGWPELN